MTDTRPTQEEVNIILKQVEVGISAEQVVHAFKECNGDLVQTICSLEGLPVAESKTYSKMEEIRDICNAYEHSMNEYVSNVATKIIDPITKQSTTCIPTPKASKG